MLVTSKLVHRGKLGNREMFSTRPRQIPLYLLFFRRWSKACMLLTCILGLTWLFGVFYINQDSLFMAYCFTIFNTLQVNHYQLLFIVLQSLSTSSCQVVLSSRKLCNQAKRQVCLTKTFHTEMKASFSDFFFFFFQGLFIFLFHCIGDEKVSIKLA